ncbi:Endonuclease/exonuclease/phosphatase [Podospora didyma]|uniref:Endonuclease/exonuclease/phosphatase n=1 Tax=Podospora didyma TaxID=330526 RepID=A0AAE0NXW3_9PEZI|nr:Endonuclease/exonuclease/phosphatase [Podospora didyma]
MDRDISPPPVKRGKITPAQKQNESNLPLHNPPTFSKTLRLFSWNINGIEPFLPPSDKKITSFFKPKNSQNQPEKEPPPSASLRAFLARHNWPEVLFLQEVKIKHGDTKTLASLLSAVNTPLNSTDELASDRTYTLDTVLPEDKYNARGCGGKLYGVTTLIRKDFAQEYVVSARSVPWDLEGRVCVVELHPYHPPSPFSFSSSPSSSLSSNDRKDKDEGRKRKRGGGYNPLALLNIYAVNGTSAPYRSPETGKIVGTRHDHKLAFHSRLRDECLRLQEGGFQVVVAGDLNVARGEGDGFPRLRTFPRQHCVNRVDFNGKFFGGEDNARARAYVGDSDGVDNAEKEGRCLDAVDVWRAMHGKERRYTYHPRTSKKWGESCDRVDLIFVSRGLWESGRVIATGILDSPQERGPSDHAPIWVEVGM